MYVLKIQIINFSEVETFLLIFYECKDCIVLRSFTYSVFLTSTHTFSFVTQVIDDMIFAIGGFNGVTTIYNVECFDPSSEEW